MAGAFITAIGGLQPRQFVENRLPTLAELDAVVLEDAKRTMQQVFGYFNSVGLTTVHSVLGSQDRGPATYFAADEQRAMRELQGENKLTLRLRLYFDTGRRWSTASTKRTTPRAPTSGSA